MKIEVTKAQLETIKSLTDDVSGMCGISGADDSDWRKHIMLIDRTLKKNNLQPRDFT